jgi:hypothetical protein
MIDAILKTACPHGVDCADHDACCERQPHLEGHGFCMWCLHCTVCHPHDCYHKGDPCSVCGTYVKDRPKPIYGEARGMCVPPLLADAGAT